jgi:hypothetical protein
MKKSVVTTNARVRNKRVELLILARNKRACCICHSGAMPIHIHHIDGLPGHNSPSNLAVLCMSHHDQATAGLHPGQVGLGRKLTPEEVRFHKKTWERIVGEGTSWKRKFAPQDKRKQSLLFFEFELIRIKNEILASRTKEAIENRFGYLTFLSHEFFRSPSPYRKLLLVAYGDLAGRSWGVKPIVLSVVRAVEDDYVNLDAMRDPGGKLSPTDKWALTYSARILGQVGYWGVIFGKDAEIVDRVYAALTELSDIGYGMEFKQLNTEIHIALDRMQSEFQRLPTKRKASLLTRKHMKRISETQKLIRPL